MMVFENQTYIGVDVELDGNRFVRCRMRDCVLIYRGLTEINLEWCNLSGSEFRYKDAAERTIHALQALASAGPSGLDHVLKLVVTGAPINWKQFAQLAGDAEATSRDELKHARK